MILARIKTPFGKDLLQKNVGVVIDSSILLRWSKRCFVLHVAMEFICVVFDWNCNSCSYYLQPGMEIKKWPFSFRILPSKKISQSYSEADMEM